MNKTYSILSLTFILTGAAWSAAPQQAEIILSSPSGQTRSDDAVSGVRKHHRAAAKRRIARHKRAAQHRATNMQAPANEAVHEATDAVTNH